MDLKDRKILYELDGNSRESFTRIGRLTGISKESARYRINNYAKEGTIKYFLTVIDATLLGASYYDIFLKLQNIDAKKKGQVISFFINSPYVTWIADIEGVFDIAVIVMVKNQLELQNLMEEMNQKFSSIIMKKTLAINLKGEFFRRDYLVGKQRREQYPAKSRKLPVGYSPKAEATSLDELDIQICRCLAKNSRMTSVELGKAFGVSPDTIMIRLRRLLERKIIRGFSIVLNNNKINQLHYKLLLHVNSSLQDKVSQLLSHIRMNNRVIALIRTLADWDYEVDVEVTDINQLKEFTMELTSSFSDVIKDYDVIRIVDMPKYNFFP